MSIQLLIVEDDPIQRRLIETAIKKIGHNFVSAENGEQALSLLIGEHAKKYHFDLVILDLVMPIVDGMQVLERLQKHNFTTPVIVQTAHGGIDKVIAAMKKGASDFMVKPFHPDKLGQIIDSALKIKAATQNSQKKQITCQSREKEISLDIFPTANAHMKNIVHYAKRAATSIIPVLIEGESGVGKEVMAKAIKNSSDRADKPFVTVNCGAIPENLVESILFGHEKGSFTGADEKHIGKFLEADGGTLFLDEVGELPLDTQVKLLRALQEKEIDPVGGKKSIKIDIRLISATNKNMLDAISENKFREDLYYRLNVFPLQIPSLRDRKEDIPALAQMFAQMFAQNENKCIEGYEEQALELLCAYHWPGNIRQLENTVFRAVVLAEKQKLSVADFPQVTQLIEGLQENSMANSSNMFLNNSIISHTQKEYETVKTEECEISKLSDKETDNIASLSEHCSKMTDTDHQCEEKKHIGGKEFFINIFKNNHELRSLEDIETEIIKMALNHYEGHISKISEVLGIGRSTLYRKMKGMGLEYDM